MVIDYRISDIVPYINWIYFFHAWGLSGKPESEQEKQKHEALRMLEEWEDRYQTHAVVEIVDANSDGDDIIAAGTRIPFLRQQKPTAEGMPNLCLADFIRPLSSGITDKLGIFAATVDAPAVSRNSSDCYQTMLAQTLADRLAEASRALTPRGENQDMGLCSRRTGFYRRPAKLPICWHTTSRWLSINS